MKKKIGIIITSLVLVFSMVAFIACDSKSSQEELVISQTSLEFDKIGEDKTLIVEQGGSKATGITWQSSDESIATVADGKVVAVKRSSFEAHGDNPISYDPVVITAKKGDKEVSCEIIVKAEFSINFANVQGDRLQLDNVADTKDLGATIGFPSVADDSDASVSKKITYSISNKSVATVDENGKVTAVSEGVAILTATTVATKSVVYYDVQTLKEEVLPATYDIVVVVGKQATDLSTFVGIYKQEIDWQGFTKSFTVVEADLDKILDVTAKPTYGWIRGYISLEFFADGTYKQDFRNLPRSGWVADVDSTLAETTGREVKAKYGTAHPASAVATVGTELTAELNNGKTYIDVTGGMAMNAFGGVYAVVGNNVYVEYNGKLQTISLSGSTLSGQYKPFSSMVALSQDISFDSLIKV